MRYAMIFAAPLLAGAMVSAPALAQLPTVGESQKATRTRPLSTILVNIRRDSGQSVLTDTALASVPATPPTEKVTAENLEDQLDALVKSLPKGTIWARLMLPPPAGGRQFSGDALVEYALAQNKLYGGVGASEAGFVEVLGQKLEKSKAEPVIAALGLKPVYIICNPSRTTSVPAGDFNALDEAQKQAWAQKQAQQILSMPQEKQMEAIGQMFQQAGLVFGNLLQNMSPDQRRNFMQSIGSFMGSIMGPGGGRVRFEGPPGGGGRP